MNANDARITRVYTAQTGSVVEDPAPNAPGPAANFDLIFQSEAGNSIGSGGGDYVLTITAYDVTTGDNNTDMTVGPLNEKFNSTFDWTASAPDFFKNTITTIDVPLAGVVANHTFYYTATLVNVNGRIVSTLQSNTFVLI
jgi:hypothetical protein